MVTLSISISIISSIPSYTLGGFLFFDKITKK